MQPTLAGISYAAALLDDGGWTLTENRRARDRAGRLQNETRELLLRYRAHQLCVIQGSSDATDAHRRLTLMRSFAGDGTVITLVAPSRGGNCILCGATIEPNEVEYEIVAPALAMTVGEACYQTFKQATAAIRASKGTPGSI